MAADLQSRARLHWDLPVKENPIQMAVDSADPVLELACFVKPPRLCFENVKIGTTKVKTLKIFNPGVEMETVVLEKFPSTDSGFAVEGLNEEESLCLQLEPQEEVGIKFSWHPLAVGNSRHLATFKWVGGQKLQVVILASSFDPNPKKKKTRRLPSRKVLQPSHRSNVPANRFPIAKDKGRFIQNVESKGHESPSVKNLVDISPDTPSRRSTFNVVQSAFGKKETVERKQEDEKENDAPTFKDRFVNKATFNVENDSILCKDRENHQAREDHGPKVQPKSEEENVTKNDVTLESRNGGKIEDSICDDHGNFAGSTFHESEIRLSSSPIKWYHGYVTTTKPKSDLHPGQVVMNGQVKQAFIPYPSFDNTDTFWNMEMSTANKHRTAFPEESLSFGSAASSLFTITREEKFAPHLEAVHESSNMYVTPKLAQSESKTLTNESMLSAGVIVDEKAGKKDNHTFHLPCKDIENEKARVEEDESQLLDFKDGNDSLEIASEAGSEDESTIRPSIGTVIQAQSSIKEAPDNWKRNDAKTCYISFPATSESDQPDLLMHKTSKKIGNSPSYDLVVTPRVSENSSKEAKTPEEIGNNVTEEPILMVEKKNTLTEVLSGELKGSFSNAQERKKVKRETKESPEQKKNLRNIKRKEGEKVVQSRYLTLQRKPKEIATKTCKEPGLPKKEGNVVDAKFKGFTLPQKRRNEAASASNTVKPSIAIKKLRLNKPKQEKIAKHPMPYAAKNMFYDERWIEKQERGFKNWLNFVLTPPDDDAEVDNDSKPGKLALESESNQPVAPTKEMLSFRMYAARRRMAKLRREACTLYQCDQFAAVIHKLEREIEHGRLAIRADRHVDADLGVRKHIADMLLSFNPLWLRIGLEVVYGEIIPMMNNHDGASLSRFIHRRLLGNPDIAAEYCHPSVPGLFKPGYVEELGKFTLKKLLLVIIYLDKAKNSRLISHDPCLFNNDSQFKSIRDMLLMFSRDYLHREGDIVKHLTYLGYSVSHVQTPLNEFYFGVNCLAVDLRDGLRLVRVVELLTKNWNLSSRLRVPAVSRLQKVHNVELAFQGLRENKLDVKSEMNIDARSIVDGHREKTLLLLWKIIFHFQVDVLLDEQKLKDEIKHLEKSKILMQEYKRLHLNKEQVIQEDEHGLIVNDLGSEKLRLLLKWSRLVGQLHGVQIENFTVSFSDGRALCYLLHHYHPALVPKETIHDETSVTCSMSQEDGDDFDDSLIYQNYRDGINSKLGKLLANEKGNISMFCEKVKEIGANPGMILASDMSNTIPDEKVVVAYLSFLCSRLLDLREEIRAARCIQVAWRHHNLKNQRRHHQAQHTSAAKLQAIVRGFLARKKLKAMKIATVKIQALWRGYKVRKDLVRAIRLEESKQVEDAAVKIQAVARGYLCRRNIQRKQMAVRFLQTVIRNYLHWKKELLRESSALLIQKRFRAVRASRIQRFNYMKMKNAALKIQRAFRKCHKLRTEKRNVAATRIQSIWKMYRERQHLLEKKRAAICIQKIWRGCRCRECFMGLKAAVGTLKTHLKAHVIAVKTRKEYLRKKQAVVLLQRSYRKYAAKKRDIMLRACICIQAHVRRYQCRKRYVELRFNTIKMQAVVRRNRCQDEYAKLKTTVMSLQRIRRSLLAGRNARKQFQRQREACISLQAFYRGNKARQEYTAMKASAIMVQAAWRTKVCRRKYLDLKRAVGTIENALIARNQMIIAKTEYRLMKDSSIKIQAAVKGSMQRAKFVQLKNSVIKMQALYRSSVEKKKLMLMWNASIVIQNRYRAAKSGRIEKKKYQQMKENCVKIQSWYRCQCSRRKYESLRRAVVACQSAYKRAAAVKRYLKIKTAALVIQRRYRAMKSSQAAQVHYFITKAAVITIQSAYRGFLVRKELLIRHRAAFKIQALIKMLKPRREYSELKGATICIQNRYRAAKLAQIQAKEFQEVRNAIIVLQAAWRGFIVRRRISTATLAATKLQATYRAHVQRKKLKMIQHSTIIIQKNVKRYQARKNYLMLKDASVKIQRTYQGYVKKKIAVERYQTQKAAVLRLQWAVRGFLTRQSLRKNRAANKLQSLVKGYLQRRKYLKLKSIVAKLQRIVRINIERRCREKAAVCIQKNWKAHKIGLSVRLHYIKQRSACVLLQSITRKWIAMKCFSRCKNAALVIQRRFRAREKMLEKRQKFLKERKNAILIQSFYRMSFARREFNIKRDAVVVLQRYFRHVLNQRNAARLDNAARMIQGWYRANVNMKQQKSKFLLTKNCAVVIQARVRGLAARKRFFSIKQAAIKIQAWHRMLVAHREFLSRKNAAVIIQRHYRAFVACEVQSACYHIMRGAVITLQATVKGFLARRRYERKRKAAIFIQTAVKKYFARKKYNELRNAVIYLQQCVRANSAGRVNRQKFLRTKSATILIQRRFRRGREVKNAAIFAQAQFRMLRERRTFLRIRKSCIEIQRSFREYLRRKMASVVVQSCWRMHARRKAYHLKKEACVKIQSAVRMHQAKQNYLLQQGAVLAIQRRYRAYLIGSLERLRYINVRQSCIIIQSSMKMWMARSWFRKLKQSTVIIQQRSRAQNAMKDQRSKFLKMKSAAIAIQRWYRCSLLAKRHRNEYLQKKANALKIQSFYRAYAAKKVLWQMKEEAIVKHNAAMMIQKCFRCHIVRNYFIKLRNAVVMVQQRYREILLTRATRNEFLNKKIAAVKIQATYRMHVAKKEVHQRLIERNIQNESAVKIQRLFRGFRAMVVCRANFISQRSAAIQIQRCFRRYRARYARRICAAMTIQRNYRAYRTIKLAERANAATKIQSIFRGFKQWKKYQATKAAILFVQRRVRTVMRKAQEDRRENAAVLIQRWYLSTRLMKIETARFEKMKQAARLIQSLWRGYVVRKVIIDREVIEARERIESANSEATEPKKLCNRTTSALSYLLNCRNVTTIYEALRNLEVSTRLSTRCCERLVEDNALQVIFQIMRNCNRSLPSIEQIHMALRVLINLSKCPTTYMAVVDEEDSLQQITEMMVNFREKKKIFPFCCTLLKNVCRDSSISLNIRENQLLSKKLKGLDALIERKAQIELKRNNSKVKTQRNVSGKEGKEVLTVIDQLTCIKSLIEAVNQA